MSETKDADINDTIDGVGLKIALDIAQGRPPDLELSPIEPSNEPDEIQHNGMRFAAFVAWMNASGFCDATWKMAFVLLGTSAESMPFNRELLEASVIRCLESQDT